MCAIAEGVRTWLQKTRKLPRPLASACLIASAVGGVVVYNDYGLTLIDRPFYAVKVVPGEPPSAAFEMPAAQINAVFNDVLARIEGFSVVSDPANFRLLMNELDQRIPDQNKGGGASSDEAATPSGNEAGGFGVTPSAACFFSINASICCEGVRSSVEAVADRAMPAVRAAQRKAARVFIRFWS